MPISFRLFVGPPIGEMKIVWCAAAIAFKALSSCRRDDVPQHGTLGQSRAGGAQGLQYRREIDGLRAVAVVPVVLYHAGLEGFRGGFIGVDVFFVVSGFLITSIIMENIRAERFSLARFYERRARRILPAMFIVMLASLAAGWFALLPAEFVQLANSAATVVFFVSNIFFWESVGYFALNAEVQPLIHTWSLAVEEQFYVLFPLFFVFVQQRSRKFAATAIWAVLLVSFALCEFASIRYGARR